VSRLKSEGAVDTAVTENNADEDSEDDTEDDSDEEDFEENTAQSMMMQLYFTQLHLGVDVV